MNSKYLYLIFILLTLLKTNIAFSFPTNWFDNTPILVSPIIVDGAIIDEIWINPNKKNVILDKFKFIKIFNPILRPEMIDKISVLENPYISKRELNKLGMKIIFNENDLILYLNIPIKHRRKNQLDLSYKGQKGTIIQNSTFSSFLNFNYTSSYENFEYKRESLHNELNLNVNGHVLNTGGFYQSDISSKKYHREYTRYIKDFKKAHARLILGDLDHNTRDLQEQYDGAGLTLQNDFSIRPSLLKTNFNHQEIELRKPSTVEIFLNESRIYNGLHPAGVLDLTSIPLALGINAIKIVLTDNNGKTQTLYYDSTFHNSLLPKGVIDYSMNILNTSSIDENEDIKYSQQQVISGYYRVGLSPNLTVGLNYQELEKNNLTGLELTSSFKNLIFQIDPSVQKYEEKNFTSYLFSMQNAYDPYSKKQLLSKVDYRYYQEDYTSMLGIKTLTKEKISIHSTYKFNSNLNIGFGIQHKSSYLDDDEPIQLSNYEVLIRPNSYFNISLRAQKDHTKNQDNSILFSLNWFEKKSNFSGSHYYQSKDHQFRNQVNYHKNLNNKKVYLASNYDSNYDTDSQTSRLYSQIETQKGSLRVDHQETGDSRFTNTNLRFALAATSDSFNLSNYINNSFLVLESNTDSKIYIDQAYTEMFQKNKGFIKTGLVPYVENSFNLNINELPSGEELSINRLTYIPTYKSGSYFKINTKKQRSIIFKIMGQKNSYLTGRLIKQEKSIPFMSGKTGNVFIPNLSPGKYTIQLDKSQDTGTIVIPKKYGYLNLGSVNFEN